MKLTIHESDDRSTNELTLKMLETDAGKACGN